MAYQWVCLRLLKCVVGCTVFGRRYYRESLAEVATISDESFVVLTIENNYNRWVEEANWNGEPGTKGVFCDALYTNSGRSTKGGRGSSRRFQGWSRKGYLRFNELHQLVKEDRKRRANFELELKKQFQLEYGGSKGNFSDSEEEDEIFPANDWNGMQQDAGGVGAAMDSDSESEESDEADDEDNSQ